LTRLRQNTPTTGILTLSGNLDFPVQEIRKSKGIPDDLIREFPRQGLWKYIECAVRPQIAMEPSVPSGLLSVLAESGTRCQTPAAKAHRYDQPVTQDHRP
jgi:hypothetical protein